MRFLVVHYPDIAVTFLGIAAQGFAVLRLVSRKWLAALILSPGVLLLLCGMLLRSQTVYASLPVAVADFVGRTRF